jgi:hypothetical protein
MMVLRCKGPYFAHHCSYGQGPPDVRDQNLMLSQVVYEVLTSIEMQGE